MNSPTGNLESIFSVAIQQSSLPKMLAYAAQACGDDVCLLGQVERLIRAHCSTTESFMESPASGLNSQLNQLAKTVDAKPNPAQSGFSTALSSDPARIRGNAAGQSVIQSLSKRLNSQLGITLRDNPGERTPAQKPNSPEIPQTESDSRYQLHGEIARGGMGAVLKGRDVDLGRDLAIKVLLDRHRDNPELIERFVDEAQIGGQLQHPGIAPVYELGQFNDERPFFTMKLVKGETLAAIMAKRTSARDDLAKLIGIFEQVCQTMAYAHSKGVIHRDLKPANIMVGAFGEVQVMDWGLAKVLSTGGVADERVSRRKQADQSVVRTRRSPDEQIGDVDSSGSQTQMGSVMGTPAYMPPEQALGEIDHLDERADVFGLGAILCEILTGKPPYVASHATEIYQLAIQAKLDDCFGRLDECSADPELVRLVIECLSVEPDQRPADAGVLAERYSTHLQSVNDRLREAELDRVAQAARVVEERKRRKVTLALAASLLLIVVLGSAAWVHNERQTASQERERVERKLAAEKIVRDDLDASDKSLALVGSIAIEGADLAEQESSISAKLIELDKALIRATQAVESAKHEEVGSNLRTQTHKKLAKVEQLCSEYKSELDRVVSFRRLRDELESIRLGLAGYEKTTTIQGWNFFANETANLRYEEAFRKVGMDLFQGEADGTRLMIDQSPIREEIIASLDQWARAISHLSPDPNSESAAASNLLDRLEIISSTANGVDPNEWRKRVRVLLLSIAKDTLLAREDDEKKRHIANLKELAVSDTTLQQSPILIGWFGAVLREVGENGAALAMLRDIQRDNPSSFWLNLEMGSNLLRAGESSQAVEYLRAALAVRPDSLEAISQLCTALHEVGRLDESHQIRKRMISLIPQGEESRGTNYKVFEKLRKEGRAPSIIAAQRAYCDAYPEDASAWMLLARMLFFQQGEVAEILPILKHVAELDPVDAERFSWVVRFAAGRMRSAGRIDDAIEAYHIAIQFAPDDQSSQRELLGTYLLMQRWDEAAEFGMQWVKENPDDAMRYLVLSPALVLSRPPSAHENHCSSMLERFADSTDPIDASRICKACTLRDGVVDASRLPVETLATALETDSVSSGALPWNWGARALVALRSKRHEEALECVLKSEQSNPPPHAHALNLSVNALANLQLGKTGAALADFGSGSRAIAALEENTNAMQIHDLLIAKILMQEVKDSLDRLLPEGMPSFSGDRSELDPRDHLEVLLRFEDWDDAAPLACRISEQLPTGNWASERARFLKRLVAMESLFDQMLKVSPNASDIWLARARLLALRSEWEAAADAFEKSKELRVPGPETWFEIACSLRLADRQNAYRDLVSTLVERMEEPHEPYDGFVFARTIGLAKQEKQLGEKAVLLAQAAIDDNKRPFLVHGLGLAQLRAGDYENARRTLTTSMNLNWGIGQNRAALALAHLAVQQQTEAEKWLTAAKEFRQAKLDTSKEGLVNALPIDWLALNALIAEAETAIENP